MNTKKVRYSAIALAVALTISSPMTSASFFAGALEPTQILNMIELIGSHLKHIQSVKKQIEQYANQTHRLKNQIKMMEQIDPGKASSLLKGVHAGADLHESLTRRFELADTIKSTLDSLQENLSDVQREGAVGYEVMKSLQDQGYPISGEQYIAAMQVLAKQRTETYGERMKRVQRASKVALDDAIRLKRIAELNPDIESEIEGIQALVKMNENLSGLISYNNQLMTDQVLTQMEVSQEQIRAIDEQRIKVEHQRQYFSDWNVED